MVNVCKRCGRVWSCSGADAEKCFDGNFNNYIPRDDVNKDACDTCDNKGPDPLVWADVCEGCVDSSEWKPMGES